jgi:hypothetical protein
MKKSFAKEKEADQSEQGLSEEEQAQLAGTPSSTEMQEMGDRSSAEMLLAAGEGNDIVGDTGDTKPRLPRLNIVQKVGPLGDKFEKGHIVLNLEDDLLDATKEGLQVTVVKALFFYEEDVPYGEDRIPERAKNAAEVRALGGELKWLTDDKGKSIRPSWHQVAEVLFCVKAPEAHKDNPTFPVRFEEKDDPDTGTYTFAMMKLKGSSFTSAGQEILTARQFYFSQGLNSGAFNMTAPLTQFRTGNSAYVCTLRKSHMHSEAFKAWLKDYTP